MQQNQPITKPNAIENWNAPSICFISLFLVKDFTQIFLFLKTITPKLSWLIGPLCLSVILSLNCTPQIFLFILLQKSKLAYVHFN